MQHQRVRAPCSACTGIARVTVKIKWGKGFETFLVVAKDLLRVARDPRTVCETRFMASIRGVYVNWLENWLIVLTTLRRLLGTPRLRPVRHAHVP